VGATEYVRMVLTGIMESLCIYMLSHDGHEWPKHVVLILVSIFKNIHPLYDKIVLLTTLPRF
jgi:hypothetical protein